MRSFMYKYAASLSAGLLRSLRLLRHRSSIAAYLSVPQRLLSFATAIACIAVYTSTAGISGEPAKPALTAAAQIEAAETKKALESVSFLEGEQTPAAASATESEDVPVRGVVRASEQATISTDLSAQVSQVTFKAGEKFRTGEALIIFDCSRQLADIKAGKAGLREMQAGYKSALVLKQHGVGARLDVETARARADRSAAELEALELRARQCTINAPFDGSIADVSIREHEFSSPGKPLISIISTKNPEIELVVPSKWLSWLTPGIEFTFFVDETQKRYKAKVQRLGAAADTVSQTLKVYAVFASEAAAVLPGSSGSASFNREGG